MTNPTTVPTKALTPKRPKPEHLAWVADLNFAMPLGLDVRAVCGATWMPSIEFMAKGGGLKQVESVGGLMPIVERRDCKNCVRVLEARMRRVSAR